jgi:hypothetical protein
MRGSILVCTLLLAVGVGMVFFAPKWLYWISPHANSAWDVLAGQYGPKAAVWIIAVTVAVVGGIFLFLTLHS